MRTNYHPFCSGFPLFGSVSHLQEIQGTDRHQDPERVTQGVESMKKVDKDELMNEVLGKKRPYSSVYTDSMDMLKSTEDELNRIIAENEKKLQEMTARSSYSEDKINSLKAEIEKDFNVKIDLPETVVVGKDSKEVFEALPH